MLHTLTVTFQRSSGNPSDVLKNAAIVSAKNSVIVLSSNTSDFRQRRHAAALPAAARRSTRCPQDWQSVDDDMRAMGFRFINRGWYWAGLQYATVPL